MTAPRDPFAAGWSLVGADGPPLCPGSGQLLTFAPSYRWLVCPECGAVLDLADGATLPDHERSGWNNPGNAPTLGL